MPELNTPSVHLWAGSDDKRFRHAYVIKPGSFDFSPLQPFCEKIIYATDGQSNHVDNLRDQLYAALAEFHPDKDVLIPVGSAMVNVLAGQIVHEMVERTAKCDSYAMGIFLDGNYHFWRIYINSDVESDRILLR